MSPRRSRRHATSSRPTSPASAASSTCRSPRRARRSSSRCGARCTEIPYGQTASYGELAARVGRPGAFRAVGAANGCNPIAVIVPCHRVIGADGTLTGYGGGLERKRALLELEAGITAVL